MNWFKKVKKENADTVVVDAKVKVEEVPEVVLTPAQKRVQMTLGDSSHFSADPRVESGIIPQDKAMAMFNGGSVQPGAFCEVVTLEPIDPAVYVQKWADVISGHNWKNNGLKNLAMDALVGLMGSFRSGMESQVPRQVDCLKRSMARDMFLNWGLTADEVRFDNCHQTETRSWTNLVTQRDQVRENHRENEYYHLYYYGEPGGDRQRLVIHDINDASVRISGQAFLGIEALKRLPLEIIEDLWIAELRGDDVPDPLLIVQIGGLSYAICSWNE